MPLSVGGGAKRCLSISNNQMSRFETKPQTRTGTHNGAFSGYK